MFPVSRTTPSSYDHSYDGVRYGPKEHVSGGWEDRRSLVEWEAVFFMAGMDIGGMNEMNK